AEADRVRAEARAHVEAAREHATGIREVARQDIVEQRATADADVAKLLQEAQDHLDWSHATAEQILAGAREQAAREQQATHRAMADHIHARRVALQRILARSTHRLRIAIRDAETHSENLREQAAAVLAAAEEAAARITERAEESAQRSLATAEEEAAALIERAERRAREA